MNPPELPKVICSEMNCWAWEKSDEENPSKECLKCKHNLVSDNRLENKDCFMTRTQRGWY